MSVTITLLGVNVLLLVALWHFVVRPTALDTCRDLLFDLRQEVRDYFAQHEGLDSPAYAHLRTMLNGYLRFTERLTFTSVFGFQQLVSHNKELFEELRRENDARFAALDTESRRFVDGVRMRAAHVVQGWLFHSSFYSCVMLYAVGFCMVLAYFLRSCGRLAAAIAATRPAVLRFRDRYIDERRLEAMPQVCMN